MTLAAPRKIAASANALLTGPLVPPLSEAQWHELELTLRADLGEPTRRAIIGKSEAYVVATALRESARKKAKLPGRGRRKSSPLSVLQHVMADCAAAWRKADADEASAMALAELGAEVSVRGGIDLQKLQSEIEATASRLGAYVKDSPAPPSSRGQRLLTVGSVISAMCWKPPASAPPALARSMKRTRSHPHSKGLSIASTDT